MKAPRIALSALALITAGAVAAGCGGEISKSDYEKDMKKINSSVSDELDSFGEGTPDEGDLSKASDSMDKAADDFEDIDPPKDIEKQHEELIKGVRGLADVLDDLGPLMAQATEDPSKLGEDDLKKMTDTQTKAETTLERLQEVEKEYKDKDYDISITGNGDDK